MSVLPIPPGSGVPFTVSPSAPPLVGATDVAPAPIPGAPDARPGTPGPTPGAPTSFVDTPTIDPSVTALPGYVNPITAQRFPVPPQPGTRMPGPTWEPGQGLPPRVEMEPEGDNSLAWRMYRRARDSSGDWSSILSMVGAGALFLPGSKFTARPLIAASIAAGGIDTAIQGVRWAQQRDGSDGGTMLYAATGLLPASSLLWAHSVMGKNQRGSTWKLVVLAANLALVGYEAVVRGHEIEAGIENLSGYLALGAALSGLALRIPR